MLCIYVLVFLFCKAVCLVSECGSSPANGRRPGHRRPGHASSPTVSSGHRSSPAIRRGRHGSRSSPHGTRSGHGRGRRGLQGTGRSGSCAEVTGIGGGASGSVVADVDVVDGFLDDDFSLHGGSFFFLSAVFCGGEDALAGAEGVQSAFGFHGAVFRHFQFALEFLHAHDVGVGNGFLLFQLALVHLDLFVELVQGFLIIQF